MEPLIWADPFLCNPMTERLVTVFPDPDSPTMATVSPEETLSDTPSTARTKPSSVGKATRRSLIRNNSDITFSPADQGLHRACPRLSS